MRTCQTPISCYLMGLIKMWGVSFLFWNVKSGMIEEQFSPQLQMDTGLNMGAMNGLTGLPMPPVLGVQPLGESSPQKLDQGVGYKQRFMTSLLNNGNWFQID